jgi:hypothetical protein
VRNGSFLLLIFEVLDGKDRNDQNGFMNSLVQLFRKGEISQAEGEVLWEYLIR